MRQRRSTARWVLCALTAIPLLLAAGCGDDDDDGGSGRGGGNTAGSDSGGDLPDLQGQTLQVLGKWSGDEQAAFERVMDDFESRTGAAVTYTSGGDNIATVIGTAVAGGNPPDVAFLPQPGLMTDLARRGALIELGDDVGSLVDDNFAPTWRELATVDDKLYGVWFKAANKSTVWYRTDIFEEADVEVPEDWDAFIDAAQQISDIGITPISVGGADGWTLTDWFENVYLRTAGPEKYGQLARHEIPWTDQSVIEAMGYLQQVWGNDELLSGGTSVALQNDFTASVVRAFSRDDQAAIVYEGDFVAGVITNSTDFTPGEDADFFAFPSIDGSEPAVMGGGDVGVMLKDNPGARALMQYLAMPESAEIWAEEGGFTSPNQEVDLDTYADDITRRSAQQLVEADSFVFDLSDLQPSAFGATEGSGMWGLFQTLLSNPTQATQVAGQLEAAAKQAYGR